jgi:hypothetical protein
MPTTLSRLPGTYEFNLNKGNICPDTCQIVLRRNRQVIPLPPLHSKPATAKYTGSISNWSYKKRYSRFKTPTQESERNVDKRAMDRKHIAEGMEQIRINTSSFYVSSFNIVTCRLCAWIIDGVLGWKIGLTPYRLNSGLQAIRALQLFPHTLQLTLTHAIGFSVFTSRILATDLSQSHCNLMHTGSFLFTALFLYCHYSVNLPTPKARLSSNSLLSISYPGRQASRNSSNSNNFLCPF